MSTCRGATTPKPRGGIAADDCDVLVDLMGHTRHSRPGILAGKPARVIVTHLGYHGALGLSQVDAKITDRYADVPDAGDYQIERPLPMASCVLPFRHTPRVAAVAPARAALGIAEDAVVFGEFVPVQKLSPRCLGLWRAILARVPRAVLLFSPATTAEHPGYFRQLAGFGIDRDRVRFVPAAGTTPAMPETARATTSSTSCSTRCPTREATRRSPRSTPACRW